MQYNCFSFICPEAFYRQEIKSVPMEVKQGMHDSWTLMKQLVCKIMTFIHVPRAQGPYAGQQQGLRPLAVQHWISVIHRLSVKYGKSDWLLTQNESSVHAKKIRSGQRSWCLVLTKRIKGSWDKNMWLHSRTSVCKYETTISIDCLSELAVGLYIASYFISLHYTKNTSY